MTKIRYMQIAGRSKGFYLLAGVFLVLTALGAWAFFHLEHVGHSATGMNNQIIWGLPHVFAIFLIVAASGALNIASIGTVFNKDIYKPLGRFSAWVSMALLLGGLIVLVLDLGQPFHVEYMIRSPNVVSIFALNVVLYGGFLIFVVFYLWTMMDANEGVRKLYKSAGTMAFIWRLVLTTGTGSIFGFLVGRAAYDSALIAPLFVVMSFALGMAIFILILLAITKANQLELGDALLMRMKSLLALFVAVVFYFVLVYHLTGLYAAKREAVELFILAGKSIHTPLFWIGQILLGSLVPLAILYSSLGKKRPWIAASAVLVILGGICQLYVIIIGGQAFPQQVVSGDYIVTASGFADAAEFHTYTPTIWEFMLGLGGVGVAALMTLFGIKLFRFLPESLADKVIDPHTKSA